MRTLRWLSALKDVINSDHTVRKVQWVETIKENSPKNNLKSFLKSFEVYACQSHLQIILPFNRGNHVCDSQRAKQIILRDAQLLIMQDSNNDNNITK